MDGAFSPARNVRALWDRAPSHLAPLDGIRALSILWVVVFHTAFFTAEGLPIARYRAMIFDPRLLPFWRGHFGVDVFFVLSGFLIAGMLQDEIARTGTIRLGRFYVRRLMRLWPALLVCLAIYAIGGGAHRELVWVNALYVSNFLPVMQAPMGWTWSLAIEEHFYLVCPWLLLLVAPLRARGRLAVIAVVIVAACVVAAFVVVHGDFRPMDTEIVITRSIPRWSAGYDALYSKPWMRVGPLLAGVGASIVHRSERAMAALSSARALGTIGFVLSLILVVLSTHWLLVVREPRAVQVYYMATYRTWFGIAVAYGILFVVSAHPVGAAIGRVLGARVLYPFAQLAYSAYLLNPMATRFVQWAVGPDASFALLAVLDLVATFGAAAVVYVLVERPFMLLRPPSKRADDTPIEAPRPLASVIAITMLAIVLPLALSAIVPLAAGG